MKETHAAARSGNLKELRKLLETAADTLERASLQITALRESWPYLETEEETYLASPEFIQELLQAAEAAGLSLQQQDGMLTCYPSLLKVQPKEKSVRIDRKPYRHLRPRHLAAYLGKRQKAPSRANLARLLESLLVGYDYCCEGKRGEIVKLQELYKRLTVLPWVRSDYSLQEFARDVYLLDGSRELTTKDGSRCRLHPGATGSKNRSNLLIVVTREGVERTYYGIEFTAVSP
jgi:hypothetical protein